MLVNKDAYQRETLTKWPVRLSLTLTLLRGWWGRCEKNYLRKEEGREGGEKKRVQRARRTRGSNPGPAAC